MDPDALADDATSTTAAAPIAATGMRRRLRLGTGVESGRDELGTGSGT